jgi:hypothetical protein
MIAAVQSSKRPGSPCHERGKIRAILPDRGEARCRQAGPQALQRLHQSEGLRPPGSGRRHRKGKRPGHHRAVRPADHQGLKESILEFRKIDEQIELQPIFDQLTARRQLDLAYGEDTESRLPEVVGGLSVALARAFKIIDGNLKNPATELPYLRSADVAPPDNIYFALMTS